MALRPESSVSVGFDAFGQLVFDGDKPAPVIHRTPEELGIPRVVPDVPRTPSWMRPPTDTGPGSAGRSLALKHRALPGTMQRNRETVKKSLERIHALDTAAKKAQDAQLKEIGGEPVVMPAAATMGAEPLEGFVAERQTKQGTGNREHGHEKGAEVAKVASRKDSMTEEAQARLVQDARVLNIDQLAAKYQVKQWKVYAVLKAHRAKCVSKLLGKPRGRNAHQQPAPKHAAQFVHVEPMASGAASALMKALSKVDHREESITLQFAVPEVVEILAGLDDARRRAFLAGGLRAALLAK